MKKIDELLKKVEVFERLAVYGDRKTFLQALAQDSELNYSPNPNIPAPGEPLSSDMGYSPNPGTAPTASNSGGDSYKPIDPNVQDMLNQLLAVQNNDILPLRLDGKLGPMTQKALSIFTQKYNKPANSQSIAQVLNSTKNDSVAKNPGAPLPAGNSNSPSVNTKSTSDQSAGKERYIDVPKV